MQFKKRFVYTALCCVLLSSSVVLLINIRAQAPKKAQIAFHSYRDGNYEVYVIPFQIINCSLGVFLDGTGISHPASKTRQ